jgi:hypothetical protein
MYVFYGHAQIGVSKNIIIDYDTARKTVIDLSKVLQ